VTMSFVERPMVDCFRLWSESVPLAVDHPSRRQENLLRQSVVPSLLAARRFNESRGTLDSELFELARVYIPKNAEGGGRRPTGPGAPGAESQKQEATLPDEQ